MSWITGVLCGIIALLAGLCLWQRAEIAEHEKNTATLKLSVESYQRQRVLDDDFIASQGDSLQKCIDDQTTTAKKFEDISRKYRNAQTTIIEKEKVLNDDLRQELRKDISKPLPFPAINGVR